MNDVQTLLREIRTNQRVLASLQDEAHVVEMDLLDYRRQLAALIEQGAQVTDEELQAVGMKAANRA